MIDDNFGTKGLHEGSGLICQYDGADVLRMYAYVYRQVYSCGGKFSIIKLMDNKFKSNIDSKWTINWTSFET